MIDGAVEHEDSAGNAGRIGPGAVQWMTAGAGVIHSEMPAREMQTEGGRQHGFQLWVNLPAAAKMRAPRYQECLAKEIPQVREDGAVVRVIAGEHHGTTGPVETHSLLADYYPFDARNNAFSFQRSALAVGAMIGPLVAGPLAAAFGWRAPFIVFTIPSAIMVLLALRMREPVRGHYERAAMGASEDAIATEDVPP